MSEHRYTRRGRRITQHWRIDKNGKRVVADEHTDHDSINAAKRASRAIQAKHDGALGLGVVRRQR